MSVPASVCVYCASSDRCEPEFFDRTRQLAQELVNLGVTVVYGAGSVGLMGALADAVLDCGGKIVGVIPEFMKEREWDHPGLTHLEVVSSMHIRKQRMLDLSDAFVALPGGTGTLEELLECISFKRLALHSKPIWIANWKNYYDGILKQLSETVSGGFLESSFLSAWQSAEGVDGLIHGLKNPAPWSNPLY